jgi:hypothetical protein
MRPIQAEWLKTPETRSETRKNGRYRVARPYAHQRSSAYPETVGGPTPTPPLLRWRLGRGLARNFGVACVYRSKG